jgi:hypothetical protein
LIVEERNDKSNNNISSIMMIDISLNEKTKSAIERSVGVPYSTICESDATSIDKMIEEKIKKPLSLNYGERDTRLPARGGVFLALRRYLKMSFVDKKLSKI